jgi:hypothetical protein
MSGRLEVTPTFHRKFSTLHITKINFAFHLLIKYTLSSVILCELMRNLLCFYAIKYQSGNCCFLITLVCNDLETNILRRICYFTPSTITEMPTRLKTHLSAILKMGTKALYNFICPTGIVSFFKTFPENHQPAMAAKLKY